MVTASGPASGSAATGSGGMYQMPGLDPGTYSLTANATGFLDGKIAGVGVTAGADSANNNFVLLPWQLPGKMALSGTVIDSKSKKGIAGAAVRIARGSFSDTRTTAANGIFYFGGLEPGLYEISATHNKYNSQSSQVPLQAASRQLTIELSPKDDGSSTGFPVNLPLSIIASIIASVIVVLAVVAVAVTRRRKPRNIFRN
jgi:hypothetical protein